jgi:predicted Fe-S protein YdhL (DUF1289 family)
MVPRISAELLIEPLMATVTAIASPIESPCNKVCVVHPVQKLCIGCGRSLDEIANWINFDGAERARLMAQLPSRLAAMSDVNSVAAKA